MPNTMLHIFRNSPIGRENLLQSVYFCRTYSGLVLEIFIPQRTHFTMDLGDELFAVQLDGSYTRYPESAEARVNEIMKGSGCEFRLIGPDTAAGVSPSHLPGTWSIISCPRVLTEDLSRIGLGHIGPKVRGLVKAAPFPVFVPSLANKAWRSVTAFFGGSELGARAVKAALAIARQAQMPAYVHTQLDGTTKADCEESLEKVHSAPFRKRTSPGACTRPGTSWRICTTYPTTAWSSSARVGID